MNCNTTTSRKACHWPGPSFTFCCTLHCHILMFYYVIEIWSITESFKVRCIRSECVHLPMHVRLLLTVFFNLILTGWPVFLFLSISWELCQCVGPRPSSGFQPWPIVVICPTKHTQKSRLKKTESYICSNQIKLYLYSTVKVTQRALQYSRPTYN